jgi:hypothetical protein
VGPYPDHALKILQLLLRCGMVCREELSVVLEMMPAAPGGRAVVMQEWDRIARQQRKMSDSQVKQTSLVLDFDSAL